jgi:hypothetical protein
VCRPCVRGRAQLLKVVQAQAQQLNDPARHRTERAGDDLAAARRQACRDPQRPDPGAVEEQHPGQVEPQPPGLVIGGQCRLFQEPASRGKIQVTAQDESAARSIADGLDGQGVRVHRFSIGSRGLDDTK